MDQQKQSRGGARRGAGRKRNPRRHDPPHRARGELSSDHPVHIVLRTLQHVPGLREADAYRATHSVLERFVGGDDFRVVHLSIQGNHFHFLNEATDRRALSRSMRSLTINLARAINREHRSYGPVFAHRYHETQITTPWQARNSIAYVLNNWRKHREDLASIRTMSAKLDVYASGLAFDGWCDENGHAAQQFTIPAGYKPLPVSPPRTSLLRSDWRRFGLIKLFETPGPMR